MDGFFVGMRGFGGLRLFYEEFVKFLLAMVLFFMVFVLDFLEFLHRLGG